MNTSSYWRFQILWWLGYSAVGLAVNIALGGNVRSLIIVHAIWVAVSIGLTHLFREVIDRYRRPDASVWRSWPLLLGGSLLIAFLQTALIVDLTATILPVSREPWTVGSVAPLAWGMWLGMNIWAAIYVRSAERRQIKERELSLRAAATEAELRALEAQVNPHFLFNCLNSIRALVAENPARAQDMITRLANIFRHNLHREPTHTVPLASEVEVVGDYLALESVRFEERLRVDIAVSPSAGKTLVPSMLLQALVENALKHGIAPRPSGGELLIRAQENREGILIEVENPGQLATAEPISGSDGEPGLGLANARERLRILYGGRASLELRNLGVDRVVAAVLIPAQA